MNQSISLELCNDRHQKVYLVQLVGRADGYSVEFQYGAKGSALAHGTKTKGPTDLPNAQRIYDKLVKEKTGKKCECCGGSYVEVGGDDDAGALRTVGIHPDQVYVDLPKVTITNTGEKGGAFAAAKAALQQPSFFPELYTPITMAEATRYINDPAYEMEEKLDGHRISLLADDLFLCAFNRKGERIPLPSRDLEELRGSKIHLDGEFVDGRFVAFDILSLGGNDTRTQPRFDRRHILRMALLHIRSVDVITTYTSISEKATHLQRLRDAHKEGVVFKHQGHPYMPGLQEINVKLKFWESATVRVGTKARDDGKASFAIEALKEGIYGGVIQAREWVNVGTVTLSKTPKLPESGTFREVKYLYVGAGGGLVQAEDLGPRTDVSEADCAFSKLKHKPKAGA